MTVLLDISGLSVRFGGVHALRDVAMQVEEGSIHGLIGPNGAGKTTLLNCIGRVIEPVGGSINFGDADLLSRRAHDLASLGVVRTFQNLALIESATSLDNVRVGLLRAGGMLHLHDFLPTGARARKEREDTAAALESLSRLGLQEYAASVVATLPYGIRKSTEIARALCARPRMLLLDEPTAGLNAREMDDLAAVIRKLRSEMGITVLLITHHIEFLLDIADRVTVLDLGRVIADGLPQLMHTDDRVRSAYLGTDE
jgi:branched-chain amino acid transport system ATP-binding protein